MLAYYDLGFLYFWLLISLVIPVRSTNVSSPWTLEVIPSWNAWSLVQWKGGAIHKCTSCSSPKAACSQIKCLVVSWVFSKQAAIPPAWVCKLWSWKEVSNRAGLEWQALWVLWPHHVIVSCSGFPSNFAPFWPDSQVFVFLSLNADCCSSFFLNKTFSCSDLPAWKLCHAVSSAPSVLPLFACFQQFVSESSVNILI